VLNLKNLLKNLKEPSGFIREPSENQQVFGQSFDYKKNHNHGYILNLGIWFLDDHGYIQIFFNINGLYIHIYTQTYACTSKITLTQAF
jgi:hypothetical protein